MSRLMVIRVAVLIALLCGGTALSAKGRLASFFTTDVRPAGLGTILQKHVPALLLAGSLLLGTQALPALAEQGEEAQQGWTEEMTQETYNSVFYMIPAEEGITTLRHVIYVGDTADGQPLFAGLYMYFLDRWQGDLLFYDNNGQLIAEGVERTDVEVFPDRFKDFNVINLFTVEGLELDGTHAPITAVSYPLDEWGKELHMVAYGMNEENPESLFSLVRRQQTCEVTDPKGWGVVGVGMSNCAPPEDIVHSVNGAPIFNPDNGELVGFYAEPARVGYVVAQNPAFVEYSSGEAGVTAVSAKGKLSTTWAAIKARH